MNRNDIDRLLVEAKRVTNHPDFVIIGSLSVLGAVANPPISMTGSIDIDLYPKNDPGRASEIVKALGLGSEFERIYGYYETVGLESKREFGWTKATWLRSYLRRRISATEAPFKGNVVNSPLAIPKTLQKRLEKVAAAARRKPEALLKTAIQNQLDYEEWVIQEIKAGLVELDHGKIVSHEDLKHTLEKSRADRAKKRRKAA